MDALEVCLQQEKDRFNKLIAVIWKSLEDIIKAIKGEILMTPILDEMYKSFLSN
jgi:dynein heavy chain